MYIKSISLENFRVFKEKQTFELAPISVLTGTNSSGKSSLFKALLLITKNLKKNSWDSLSYSGGNHKLGTFGRSVNDNSEKQEWKLAYKLDLGIERFQDQASQSLNFLFSKDVTFEITFSSKDNEHGKLKEINVFFDDNLTLVLNRDNNSKGEGNHIQLVAFDIAWFLKEIQKPIFESKKIISNKPPEGKFQNLFKAAKQAQIRMLWGDSYSEFVPKILEMQSGVFDDTKIAKYFPAEKFDQDWIGKMKSILASNLGVFIVDTSNYLVPYFHTPLIDDTQDLLKECFELYSGENLKLNSREEFYMGNKTLYDLGSMKEKSFFQDVAKAKEIKIKDILKDEFPVFIKFIKQIIDEVFSEVGDVRLTYMEAIRALSKRIYSDNNNDEFNQLLIEFRNNPPKGYKLEFINKWIKEFQIGDEINIEDVEGVATKIFLSKNGKQKALADLGYGITQLLPIIIQTVLQHQEITPVESGAIGGYNPKRRLFLIEEPEANLHPALQSKLADFFVDAMKSFNVHFIIETHSEYLIRKLQYLTLKKEITPSDTSIHYLYDPENIPEGENQVIKLNILEDGRLDKEFGRGFFDEASNLMLSLLTGKSSN